MEYYKKSIYAVTGATAVAKTFQTEISAYQEKQGYVTAEEKRQVAVCEEVVRLATLAAYGTTLLRFDSDALLRILELVRGYIQLDHRSFAESAERAVKIDSPNAESSQEEEEVF